MGTTGSEAQKRMVLRLSSPHDGGHGLLLRCYGDAVCRPSIIEAFPINHPFPRDPCKEVQHD